MPLLHRNEKEIIRTIFREGRPLSISEISMRSGMSWVTAKKYLERCLGRRLIAEQVQHKQARYIIEPKLIQALLERGESHG
ncbi:MAG: hypothetical protein ACQESG_07445 [Nanobdellota archaeon]